MMMEKAIEESKMTLANSTKTTKKLPKKEGSPKGVVIQLDDGSYCRKLKTVSQEEKKFLEKKYPGEFFKIKEDKTESKIKLIEGSEPELYAVEKLGNGNFGVVFFAIKTDQDGKIITENDTVQADKPEIFALKSTIVNQKLVWGNQERTLEFFEEMLSNLKDERNKKLNYESQNDIKNLTRQINEIENLPAYKEGNVIKTLKDVIAVRRELEYLKFLKTHPIQDIPEIRKHLPKFYGQATVYSDNNQKKDQNKVTVYGVMDLKAGDGEGYYDRFSVDIEKDIAKNITEFAHALDLLMENGIIHGDLKASNVLYGKDGTLFLSDFGSASMTIEEKKLQVINSTDRNFVARELYFKEDTLDSVQNNRYRESIATDIENFRIGLLIMQLSGIDFGDNNKDNSIIGSFNRGLKINPSDNYELFKENVIARNNLIRFKIQESEFLGKNPDIRNLIVSHFHKAGSPYWQEIPLLNLSASASEDKLKKNADKSKSMIVNNNIAYRGEHQPEVKPQTTPISKVDNLKLINSQQSPANSFSFFLKKPPQKKSHLIRNGIFTYSIIAIALATIVALTIIFPPVAALLTTTFAFLVAAKLVVPILVSIGLALALTVAGTISYQVHKKDPELQSDTISKGKSGGGFLPSPATQEEKPTNYSGLPAPK
jgi:serine/threonine protein kinase